MWSKIINLIKKITSLVKKAEDIKDKIEEALPKEEQSNTPDVEADTDTKVEADTNTEADDKKFAGLNWMYGGFNGKGAKRVKGAVIANLKVTKNGLSYAWNKGGCELLGADTRTDPSATLACLFCKIDGQWQGGKFDWISTSRLTRGFENIRSGYKGWDPQAIEKASSFAFVIVSADGKHRTNVIEAQNECVCSS